MGRGVGTRGKGYCMGRAQREEASIPVTIAPVFWAWAQQQAAPEEPLHLTRRRALRMQSQADAELAKAVHREAFLAVTGARR